MATITRPILGSYMSMICFQYLREGAEDAAGRALIVTAGRKRGQDVIKELGLEGSSHDADALRAKLDVVLGADGTKLCIVDGVTTKANGGYEVRTKEGAEVAGMTSEEPHCAFTLGVFTGAISALTGQQMIGSESQCSATGSAECVYQIDPFA
ncbi:MAG: hypothetical protein EI684_13645 [Candidatus Viridilinea halotolerans]|uniref:4-vinyl reductase 4VR domain-containing protein n=1 Tax=Candidatus Viridilinea halotolerans TaxID=2491704 RepID=A0A426TX76_9CHLR|nr:MAG: hypothetical protein EI684_13645 [Candidatus Viridilinea halotolerans]